MSPEADHLQGIWLSDGYGIAAEITGQRVESFAAANNTCLSDGSDPLHGLLQAYDIDVAADAQSFLLRQHGTAQAIRFNRVPALPAACTAPPLNTPLGNFDAFVDLFATHYAFFDLYHVNWTARTARARLAVTAQTSDQELFAILSNLISPLDDGHVGLMARIDGERLQFEPNPGALFERIAVEALVAGNAPNQAQVAFRDAYRHTHIPERILAGTGTTAGHDFIHYGMLSPNVGYISFLTMAGFATGDLDNLQGDIEALHTILDDVLASFDAAGAERVIVDLSLNFGGYDEVSFAIASRFASAPVFALSEFPADAEEPITLRRNVTPYDGTSYTGPLTLITSDMTVSAGEILSLALRALPQTTHVGEPTRGAFSDVLEKELPNGWRVELSNEVYRDHRGVAWEGRGITPHHHIPVFEGANPLDLHATAIRGLVNTAP